MRGFIQKLKYRRRLNELHSHPEEVVKVRYLNYIQLGLVKTVILLSFGVLFVFAQFFVFSLTDSILDEDVTC